MTKNKGVSEYIKNTILWILTIDKTYFIDNTFYINEEIFKQLPS